MHIKDVIVMAQHLWSLSTVSKLSKIDICPSMTYDPLDEYCTSGKPVTARQIARLLYGSRIPGIRG